MNSPIAVIPNRTDPRFFLSVSNIDCPFGTPILTVLFVADILTLNRFLNYWIEELTIFLTALAGKDTGGTPKYTIIRRIANKSIWLPTISTIFEIVKSYPDDCCWIPPGPSMCLPFGPSGPIPKFSSDELISYFCYLLFSFRSYLLLKLFALDNDRIIDEPFELFDTTYATTNKSTIVRTINRIMEV